MIECELREYSFLIVTLSADVRHIVLSEWCGQWRVLWNRQSVALTRRAWLHPANSTRSSFSSTSSSSTRSFSDLYTSYCAFLLSSYSTRFYAARGACLLCAGLRYRTCRSTPNCSACSRGTPMHTSYMDMYCTLYCRWSACECFSINQQCTNDY